MDQPSDDDPPGFAEWLEQERIREREETMVRCPSCGTGMPTMLRDGSKPDKTKGHYYWWCPEETCLKKWESHQGELRPRQLMPGEM